MKVLLDEQLPHRLRNHLGAHHVFTVRYQGWSGLKNGELITAAEIEGFDVFVTGDKSISYEQNLASRRIAVVVLSAIEWHIIRHSLSVIQGVVEASAPGSYQTVECGMFNRRPPVTLE